MKHKKRSLRAVTWLLCAAMLFVGCEPTAPADDQSTPTEATSMTTTTTTLQQTGPRIAIAATEYGASESIAVTFADTDDKDWIGVYPANAEPGTMDSLVWKYAEGSGTVYFSAASFGGPGDYAIYLCDNDGYAILDIEWITVRDDDPADYGAKDASVKATVENGASAISVSVTPGAAETITYTLYWSKGTARLEGYIPLAVVEHAGSESFTVELNDCLFMPDEADGIEVAVAKGDSKSVFAAAPATLKRPESTLLYEFQVITDLHINERRPVHTSHLTAALKDIDVVSPNSVAIFSVGDNTDRGTQEDYDLLLSTIAGADVDLPPIYYAMGNHDTVYSGTYQQQVDRFLDNLGMDGVHYAVELNGTKFIVLGSDVQIGEGELHREQLDWLREELAETDKSQPVFLFLHQPLIDTVSGSLYSSDPDIQYWYGLEVSGAEVRTILSDYPNAILFTGHTHWSFEMNQPLLYGEGEDATFANAASVGYLWSDEDKAIGGSEGYYIEVYEDYILLKGREYMQRKWCAAAQFLIPITK